MAYTVKQPLSDPNFPNRKTKIHTLHVNEQCETCGIRLPNIAEHIEKFQGTCSGSSKEKYTFHCPHCTVVFDLHAAMVLHVQTKHLDQAQPMIYETTVKNKHEAEVFRQEVASLQGLGFSFNSTGARFRPERPLTVELCVCKRSTHKIRNEDGSRKMCISFFKFRRTEKGTFVCIYNWVHSHLPDDYTSGRQGRKHKVKEVEVAPKLKITRSSTRKRKHTIGDSEAVPVSKKQRQNVVVPKIEQRAKSTKPVRKPKKVRQQVHVSSDIPHRMTTRNQSRDNFGFLKYFIDTTAGDVFEPNIQSTSRLVNQSTNDIQFAVKVDVDSDEDSTNDQLSTVTLRDTTTTTKINSARDRLHTYSQPSHNDEEISDDQEITDTQRNTPTTIEFNSVGEQMPIDKQPSHNTSIEDNRPTLPPILHDVFSPEYLAEKLARSNIKLYDGPRLYRRVSESRYVSPAVRFKKNDILNMCGCSKSDACSANSQCLNRYYQMDCFGRCALEKSCKNRDVSENNAKWMLEATRCDGRNQTIVANTPIREGEYITKYLGEVVTNDERVRREKVMEGAKNAYFMSLDNNQYVDARYIGNESRQINHSCTPNAHVKFWSVDGETQLAIFAMEDIDRGDEITINYGWLNKIKCLCGTSKCKGYIC